MRIANLPEYTVDWQHLACLLYALDEMGCENTRSEILEFIRSRHYLHLDAIDRTPYATQTESRWQTDIAWSRKIGVISGLVSYNSRNAWGISRLGRETIHSLIAHGKEIQVHRCFLWSTEFKRTFQPDYQQSQADLPRPERWTRISTPDLPHYYAADILLGMDEVQSVLIRMSKSLGFTVMPNRVSLAFALQEINERKKAGAFVPNSE